jgi:hypothetical protein
MRKSVEIQRAYDSENYLSLHISGTGLVQFANGSIANMSMASFERGWNILRKVETERKFVFSGLENRVSG